MRNRSLLRRPAGLALGVVGVLVMLAAPAILVAEEASEASWFEDRTEAAGVSRPHTNRSFENTYAHIMEGYTALGAAVATADYNRDGFDDLYVTDSKLDGKNFLYRNNGDFTFTEVGEAAGIAGGNDKTNAVANALWFDHNNDSWPDLFVMRFGTNLLYENNGDGTFRKISRGPAFEQYLNCIAAVAFDYDLDGDLDLFLGNYFQPVNLFDPETPRFFPESFETAANGGGVSVLRNDGGGDFTDVTKTTGIAISGWTLDLGHADLDHDGDEDLYVAADFGTDNLFINQGDGTFVDTSLEAIGVDTKKGMNVDWGDFDGDGLFDIYVTNITDEYMNEGNFLWRNNGDGTFSDVGRETGTHNTGWGWAGKFFDYDNDSWLDLYVVDGWVSAGPENYVLDVFKIILQPDVDLADARNWPPMGNKTLSGYQTNRLFHNQGGTLFRDEAPRHGLDSKLDGRGIAVVDIDNDGRLDLFVTNANTKPFLWRNVQPTGHHWVELELEGTRFGAEREAGKPATPRDAIGARLKATIGGREQWSFVNGGNGFASQSTRRVHFGLAEATKIDKLEVLWPSGLVQTFEQIAADKIYRIVEGKNELAPLKPGVVPAGLSAKAPQGDVKTKEEMKAEKAAKKKAKKAKKKAERAEKEMKSRSRG